MVYNFQEEDFVLRRFWLELGVDTYITLFLNIHEDIVRSAYDEMIKEMEKVETDENAIFRKSLNYEEFSDVSKFVFRVRLVKHIINKARKMSDKIAKTPNGDFVFALTCKTFAENLYYNYNKDENVNLVERNVKDLCRQLKSQFEVYSNK